MIKTSQIATVKYEQTWAAVNIHTDPAFVTNTHIFIYTIISYHATFSPPPVLVAFHLHQIQNLRTDDILINLKSLKLDSRLNCSDALPRTTSITITSSITVLPISFATLALYTVFQKKTPTHIIGYKLRSSCLILIIFDIKITHII